MIVFDLECINGHAFEGWFEDKDDLDRQMEQAVLQCPVCETTSIIKKVHPISIKTSSSSSMPCGRNHTADDTPECRAMMEQMLGNLSRHLEQNFEDVGTSFADKALKMHYGVCEHKNIRGTTTREEEKILKKEGVPMFKIPMPKPPKEELN